jgi:hypothetical protein
MNKKPSPPVRIRKIKQYINGNVTTILPSYEFNGEQYVPLEQAQYLVKAIENITKLANGEKIDE